MKAAYVESISVVGAGCPAGDAYLEGGVAWSEQLGRPVGPSGGGHEARRSTPLTRLVLQVIAQHQGRTTIDATHCRAVFACSDGDLQVVDNICSALTLPGQPVSPTQFHNVVHNAPAGHWSLGAKSVAPSTSLSGRYDTFAVGLLDVFSCLNEIQAPVLFVCYCHPGPARIDRYIPRTTPFAVSMLLMPEETPASFLALRPRVVAAGMETALDDPDLELLRVTNPAAKALPMLHAVVNGTECEILLSLGASTLAIGLEAIARVSTPFLMPQVAHVSAAP